MVLYTFYRIVCNDLNVNYCYVGSTQNFTRRKHQHKSDCNNNYTKKVYKIIRDNGGWDNFSMIKIEDSEHETKLDAHKRERELLEQFGNGMNTLVPSRSQKETDKQYYEQNKEQIREKHKQYYEHNKEQILEQAKQKYNCECGGKYTHTNKSTHLKSQRHQNFLQTAE